MFPKPSHSLYLTSTYSMTQDIDPGFLYPIHQPPCDFCAVVEYNEVHLLKYFSLFSCLLIKSAAASSHSRANTSLLTAQAA